MVHCRSIHPDPNSSRAHGVQEILDKVKLYLTSCDMDGARISAGTKFHILFSICYRFRTGCVRKTACGIETCKSWCGFSSSLTWIYMFKFYFGLAQTKPWVSVSYPLYYSDASSLSLLTGNVTVTSNRLSNCSDRDDSPLCGICGIHQKRVLHG
jgi:hypothetical protein